MRRPVLLAPDLRTTGLAARLDAQRARRPQPHQTLVDRYARYTAFLRDTLEEVKTDLVTQDLVIETLRTVELDQWFLESHVNV